MWTVQFLAWTVLSILVGIYGSGVGIPTAISSSEDSISLAGEWRLKFYKDGKGEGLGVFKPGYDDTEWIKAQVPGEVHLELLRLGEIPDPFYGINYTTYADCQWIEDMEWWYRRRFVVTEEFKGDFVGLVFDGLDTYATVWVNGEKIGEWANQFVPVTFDVTEKLRYGDENLLTVRLASAVRAVEGKDLTKLKGAGWNHEKLYARKVQSSYGWDICPRLVTAGIWKSARLISHEKISIDDVFIKPKIVSSEKAKLTIEITLTNYILTTLDVDLQIKLYAGEREITSSVIKSRIEPGEKTTTTYLEVKDAQLWWPVGYGKPSLYRLVVKVMGGGKSLDEYSTRFGIREVELVQEPQDEGKTSFYFLINGLPIFVKGTNWVPADAIPTRAIAEGRYPKLIDFAKRGNINMFRIWGGGMYEADIFYDLCDELGIMVWQDFMYACSLYPEDEDFLKEAKREAEIIVRKLRNHPSIVLWCGDNETLGMNFRLLGRNHKIQAVILKEVCSRLDPTRPYHGNSPSDGKGGIATKDSGDTHNWHHGASYKSRFYTEDTTRFVSEIGYLSLPCLKSIEKFIPEEEQWPMDNENWYFHSNMMYTKPDDWETGIAYGKRRLDWCIQNLTESGFGLPDSLEETILYTQLCQAMALKSWIEHYRRRKFDCGGILYWNLADCWPQMSDAVIDYYLEPKIAYYYATRAYAPVVVSFKEEFKNAFSLWVINDALRKLKGNLSVSHRSFLDNKILWSESSPIEVPSNASVKVKHLDINEVDVEENEYLHARLIYDDSNCSVENTYFFVEPVHLWLPETSLAVDYQRIPAEELIYKISVKSDNYARLVQLETPDGFSLFSDNYFDLLPGEKREILISMPKKPQPLVVKAWNSKSVKVSLD